MPRVWHILLVPRSLNGSGALRGGVTLDWGKAIMLAPSWAADRSLPDPALRLSAALCALSLSSGPLTGQTPSAQLFDMVPFDLIGQTDTRQAQFSCGFALVPAMSRQGVTQQFLFQGFDFFFQRISVELQVVNLI